MYKQGRSTTLTAATWQLQSISQSCLEDPWGLSSLAGKFVVQNNALIALSSLISYRFADACIFCAAWTLQVLMYWLYAGMLMYRRYLANWEFFSDDNICLVCCEVMINDLATSAAADELTAILPRHALRAEYPAYQSEIPFWKSIMVPFVHETQLL